MKLFKLYRLILALMLVAALSGCATSNITARHSYDSSTDFSGLNSYAWMPGYETAFSTPEGAKHFQITMDNMLATKGFKLNPNTPDFLIQTHPVKSYVEKYTHYSGNYDFQKGMLRINFLIPSSKEVIYEGAATAYYDDSANQKAKNAIIDKAVEALLSDFPPGR